MYSLRRVSDDENNLYDVQDVETETHEKSLFTMLERALAVAQCKVRDLAFDLVPSNTY